VECLPWRRPGSLPRRCCRKGHELGLGPLTAAVLDPGGHLVVLNRDDGSGILRPEIAIGKAWGRARAGPAGPRARPARRADAGVLRRAQRDVGGQGRARTGRGAHPLSRQRGSWARSGCPGTTSDQDEACALHGVAGRRSPAVGRQRSARRRETPRPSRGGAREVTGEAARGPRLHRAAGAGQRAGPGSPARARRWSRCWPAGCASAMSRRSAARCPSRPTSRCRTFTGHEISGRVVELNGGSGPAPGTRVVVFHNWGCQQCAACRSGLDNILPDAARVGSASPTTAASRTT